MARFAQNPQPLVTAGFGALVGPERALTAPVPSSLSPNQEFGPRIASNGEIFLMVWQEGAFQVPYDIMGARIGVGAQVLDPIGLSIAVDAGEQWRPDVASDGKDFLVVWETPVYSRSALGAARVRADGSIQPLPALRLGRSRGWAITPRVASNGKNYLVVWGIGGIFGQRVSLEGELLDFDPIPIDLAPEAILTGIASNGQDYLVTERKGLPGQFNGPHQIAAVRVSGGGLILDPQPITVCSVLGVKEDAQAASVNGDYLVVWMDRRKDTQTLTANDPDIYAARVTAGGQVLDQGGFPVCTTSGWKGLTGIAQNRTNYLVTWTVSKPMIGGDELKAFGARITSTGTLLDPNGARMGTQPQSGPLAYAGGEFLMAFDFMGRDLYGARLNDAGQPLIPFGGFEISLAENEETAPTAASNGETTLVVWLDNRRTRQPRWIYRFDVFGLRLSKSGSVLDSSPLLIGTDVTAPPTVASDGSDFLVLVRDRSLAWQSVRVRGDGSVESPFNLHLQVTNGGTGTSVALASNGQEYLAAWREYFLTPPRFETKQTVFARRLDRTGHWLDAKAFQLYVGPEYPADPVAASNGQTFMVGWAHGNGSDSFTSVRTKRLAFEANVTQIGHGAFPIQGGSWSGVALSSAGEDYLAAWFEWDTKNQQNLVRGLRFDARGNALDRAPMPIAFVPTVGYNLRAASRQNDYLLTWESDQPGGRFTVRDVYGAFIPKTGISSPVSPIALNTTFVSSQSPVAVASERGYTAFYSTTDLRGIMRTQSRPVEIVPGTEFRNRDSGQTELAGHVVREQNLMTAAGSGTDFSGAADGFHFAHWPAEGDFEVTAHLRSLSASRPAAAAGVLIREQLDDSGHQAFLGQRKLGNLRFARRMLSATDAIVSDHSFIPSDWFKLVRLADTIAGYASDNGTNWTLIDFTYLPLSNRVHAGVAVSSAARGELALAQFDFIKLNSLTAFPSSGISSEPKLLVSSDPAGRTSSTNSVLVPLLALGSGAFDYVLEVSTNLADWTVVRNVRGFGEVTLLAEQISVDRPRAFFRLRARR